MRRGGAGCSSWNDTHSAPATSAATTSAARTMSRRDIRDRVSRLIDRNGNVPGTALGDMRTPARPGGPDADRSGP